jgi:hypothetical protein
MQPLPVPRRPRPLASAARVALLGAALILGACQNKSEKTEEAKPAAATAETKAKPKPAAAGPAKPKPQLKRLEWDDPKQWKRVTPSSSMRVASYQIPPVAGDKQIAELNVFVLGGDIESNIQRWIDEFSGFDPKSLSRSDRSVNDMTQAVVEIPSGTFNGGMSEDSSSGNFGLLGGIVVTPEDAKYFFKLTGPSATVKSAREPFYALLDSVRLEGGAAAPQTAKTLKTIGGSASNVAPAAAAGDKPAATEPASAPAPKH